MPLSKPFSIATEGQTIDGRNISRDWIIQMAKHYDPKVYTAVANLEHYLSAAPDSVFSAFGKVVSLSTQEADIMGEKKLQLLAVVDVNETIVALQKSGKKAFASIEITANFINKGIAYLTGLAFTDTPASVGTEAMKFSAVGAGKDDVYSFDEAIAIEFEDEKPSDKAGASLLSKVKELLGLKGKTDDARFADIGLAVEALAVSQKDLLEQFAITAMELKKTTEALTAATQDAAEGRKAFADFKAAYEAQPDGTSQRPPAAGGNSGGPVTDC